MNLKYNVSYEVASIIFLIILLFFMRLQYDMHSELNKKFRKLTWSGLIATMLDVATAFTISYINKVPIAVNVLLNTLYFMSGAFLGYQLMHYSEYYVYRNSKKSKFLRFNQVLVGLYVMLLVVNIFTGWIFSFTADAYVKGPMYLIVYFIPYYFILCSAVILIGNFQKYQLWQRISVIVFLIFQIFGAMLQMIFFPNILLFLFSSSLGLMMILFTMETPDYQKLMSTISELSETKKEAEQAKEEAERAREMALEASQAKSAFLANMSHEIRTPINAVLGMDEMILRESKDSNILEHAADIKRAGNMLLSLINDILDFSKIESGKMDIVPADYDFGIALCETIDMIRTRAEKKNLALELQIATDTPVHLHGDEVRIRQIITNILTNAVKYTSEGKVTLTVSCKKESEQTVQLYVSVKDTGIGIKEEDLERLFDAFQRVDESRNRNIEGTGLGLSITMRLLNLMGSRLEVKSTYGKGSDFYFYVEQRLLDNEVIGTDLKKYYEKEKGSISIDSNQFLAPDAKILVVDDNDMNLKVFVGLLKNHGMQIDTAMSGKECLALIQEKAYHIIFLDYQMPEMDGLETFKRIRELKENRSKDAVVIALTANAVSGAKEMFLQEGFRDYLSKPIIASKLDKMIKKYLPKELVLETKVEQQKEPSAKTVVGQEESLAETQEYKKDERQENGLVDWNLGRAYCMENEEFYREVLQVLLTSNLDEELIRYYGEADFENYLIKAHAVKTNMANIGALEASDMAKELELALKLRGDVTYVQEHHDEFLAMYGRVMEEVKRYLRA